MNEFLIELQAKLDEAKSKGLINSDIKNLQNQLNRLKLQAEIDPKTISDLTKEIEKVINQKITVSNINVDIKSAQQTGQQIGNAINQGVENGVSRASEKISFEMQKLTNQTNKIQLTFDTGGYDSKVETLIAKTKQWTDQNGEARISTTNLSTALEKLTVASTNLTNNYTVENQKALVSAEKELDSQIKTVTNSIKSMNAEFAKDSSITSLHNQIQKFYDDNGAAHRKWGTQLKQMLSETASGAQVTNDRILEIKTAFNEVASAAQRAGKVGKTWFQSFKDATKFLTNWMSPTFITMKAISEIKQGINNIRELDTALVDLKKTTSMTSDELEDFYYTSNKVAKQMGVTTEEIINLSSAWSRLGFDSAEAATKMAQLNSKFAIISPGMSTDQAQEGLVSIIKAWGLDVSDVEREVMDNINTLGNKFAESNADIVEGMKRSAAALAATGTTYQDAFALFTGAQEVLQNAEVGGRALRTISMRVHGYSEDSEDGLLEVDEELKNITGDLIDLTKTAEHTQGVSIFKEGSDSEFKSLVQYFGEINEIWDEMSQKQQNDFLDKAFGKNQAQAGSAIIQNYKAVTDAIEAMEDAAGSSEREMSIIMDSLDYKLNRLSETGTSIAQNLFQRDDMKTVVDGLTSVVSVIDTLTSKLGLFGTIISGVGVTAFVKNFA